MWRDLGEGILNEFAEAQRLGTRRTFDGLRIRAAYDPLSELPHYSVPRICKQCGATITLKSPWQVRKEYCNKACSIRARRAAAKHARSS